ncbi:nickel pincer cofactor biosynthesis protein LarC [Coriobacteriia bacterium Es71-Z0120]|uniref:nickel pincer cofactor biosynthesis protein LarC n=1 Tax=Parvivirga hydrogeniphila TaxID=2939460 RepID=UPI002260A489|nr:nickel pincer cofactor biosynthesis protein LarC [Parvivirga hydrogeniphila]MCL4078271.1 nickel pincer cofactor biosynthesis protein LarC [Parvivirga hydrogeniphila]
MIAYLDCAATGVSGDKFVGALLSAGFDERELRRALAPIGLADAVTVVERKTGGVVALGIEVACDDAPPLRTWPEVRDLVQAAGAPSEVLARATDIVAAIAHAEARVHGVALEEVHFHEVGACDTIVDALGAALGMHALGIDALVCSPIAVGSGTVRAAHGELPVPAPATALLLAGAPVVAGAAAGELTTPTGAAIVRTLAASFGAVPPMRLAAVGRGAGSRDLGVPNLVQLLVGEPLAPKELPPGTEPVVLLETNVDHLSPEALAFACERILEAGALDVWQTPIVMKKGRAAYLLSALASPEAAAELAAAIVRETGTLGVRVCPTERFAAWRSTVELHTSLGSARFKVWRSGEREGIRVEHDDAARIARETDAPLGDVIPRLESEARDALAREQKR